MTSFLLLESGDRLLTEAGDPIVLEDHVAWLSQFPLPDLIVLSGRCLAELVKHSDAVEDPVQRQVLALAVIAAVRAIAVVMRRRQIEAE